MSKTNSTPPQPTDTGLPEGWVCAPVRDVLDVRYGKGLPEKNRKQGPYAVFGSNGIVGHHDEPLTAGPAIILGRKGTVGAVHYSPQPCWPIDTTYFIEELPELDMGFLYYALSTLGLSEMDTSSAIPGLNREDVFVQMLPLAPLVEQKRIVAKVEALLELVSAARSRLAKLPAILKRFRQSTLAAACSGQLTAGIWDEKTEDWDIVCLGDIAISGFQNGLYKPRSTYGEGTPIVRIADFYDGVVAPQDTLNRLRTDAHEIETYGLRVGDILINRVNSMPFLGKSALVRQLSEPCVFESNMMRFRSDTARAIPEYLVIYLISVRGMEQLRRNAKHAVNQSSINQQDVAAVEILAAVFGRAARDRPPRGGTARLG